MPLNKSFEAIYRLACFLDQENETERDHHQMGYLALANYLKHSGYVNANGEPYDDQHAKGAAAVIDHCWDYVRENYGEEAAKKVFRAYCDKDGLNRSRKY